MNATDTLIVGGGLIGMLSAVELAHAGCQVALLERGRLGRESSLAGGGILAPLYPWRAPSELGALTAWSQGAYPGFAQDLQARCGVDPEFSSTGMLILDVPDEPEALAWATSTGTKCMQLSATALAQREPWVGAADHGALWLPDIAQIRNPCLIQALRLFLQHLHISCHEDLSCQEIVHDGKRVTGIRTAKGILSAPQVVVTAGAWSGGILKGMTPQLEIRPARGQMLVFDTPPGSIRTMVLKDGKYLIPRRDGKVLAGSTVEDVGYSKDTTATARTQILDAAWDMAPGIKARPITAHWAGLRPRSMDGLPFIGPHPALLGLYVNAGHYRTGLLHGLGSARLLADLMVQRAPIVDPAPFRLDRPPRADHDKDPV